MVPNQARAVAFLHMEWIKLTRICIHFEKMLVSNFVQSFEIYESVKKLAFRFVTDIHLKSAKHCRLEIAIEDSLKLSSNLIDYFNPPT